MAKTIISDSAAPALPTLPKTAWLPVALVLALLWLLVFYRIHPGWISNVVYSYGWAVPVLAAYLGWQRWETRPVPSAIAPPWLVSLTVILILLAYFPVRVVQEANPDWVKVNWCMVGLAVIMTLVVAWSAGGFRWARHFTFPALFCFTAVPWPVWMEETLVQSLMQMNASVCAEVLTLFGLPALAQGNLIQIATTWLNVEEACSGIRSLQTSFMMGLFLGEFYSFGLIRRGFMLLAALGMAVLSNVLRTIVLAYLANGGAMEKWHDTVGNVAMIVTLAGVWGCSMLLRPKTTGLATTSPQRPTNLSYLAFPTGIAIAGCAFLVASEILTEVWYRAHERRVAAPTQWTLSWPKDAREFRQMPFPERTQALLHFDSGESATWVDRLGHQWGAYFLKWEPGRVSKYLAMSHYPTVCLPATGLSLVSEAGAWDFRANGIRIPFTNYIFRDGQQDVHVFHAIIEDRPLQEDFRFSYYQVNTTERLASVLRGERNLGQRVIGISLRGCSSPTQARAIVEESLKQMITLSPSLAANKLQ